jgi:hypothetical protein
MKENIWKCIRLWLLQRQSMSLGAMLSLGQIVKKGFLLLIIDAKKWFYSIP